MLWHLIVLIMNELLRDWNQTIELVCSEYWIGSTWMPLHASWVPSFVAFLWVQGLWKDAWKVMIVLYSVPVCMSTAVCDFSEHAWKGVMLIHRIPRISIALWLTLCDSGCCSIGIHPRLAILWDVIDKDTWKAHGRKATNTIQLCLFIGIRVSQDVPRDHNLA